MAEKAERNGRRERRNRRIVLGGLWCSLAGAVLSLGISCASVAVPALRARAVVNEFAGHMCGRSASLAFTWWGDDYKAKAAGEAIEKLGGPGAAPEPLAIYARLPLKLAPHKETAVFMISCCGQKAVPVLAGLAERDDTNVYACCGLGHIGKPALPVLENLLGSEYPWIRHSAVEALTMFAESSSEALRLQAESLGDPAWEVRAAASQGVARIILSPAGKGLRPHLVEALTSTLASKNPDARAAATMAVLNSYPQFWKKEERAAFGDIEAAIKQALSDEDRRVRCYAACVYFCLTRKANQSAPVLIRFLKGASETVRGDIRHHPIHSGNMYCQYEDDELRSNAAYWLIRMREAPGIDKLPDFEAAMRRARSIIRAANRKWKLDMSTGE